MRLLDQCEECIAIIAEALSCHLMAIPRLPAQVSVMYQVHRAACMDFHASEIQGVRSGCITSERRACPWGICSHASCDSCPAANMRMQGTAQHVAHALDKCPCIHRSPPTCPLAHSRCCFDASQLDSCGTAAQGCHGNLSRIEPSCKLGPIPALCKLSYVQQGFARLWIYHHGPPSRNQVKGFGAPWRLYCAGIAVNAHRQCC